MWEWLFLTSEVMETVRGQNMIAKLNISSKVWVATDFQIARMHICTLQFGLHTHCMHMCAFAQNSNALGTKHFAIFIFRYNFFRFFWFFMDQLEKSLKNDNFWAVFDHFDTKSVQKSVKKQSHIAHPKKLCSHIAYTFRNAFGVLIAHVRVFLCANLILQLTDWVLPLQSAISLILEPRTKVLISTLLYSTWKCGKCFSQICLCDMSVVVVFRYEETGSLWLWWSIDCKSTCSSLSQHVESQSIDHHSHKIPLVKI